MTQPSLTTREATHDTFSLHRLTELLGRATRTIHDMGDGERLTFVCPCVAETYGTCDSDEAVWWLRLACEEHKVLFLALAGLPYSVRGN